MPLPPRRSLEQPPPSISRSDPTAALQRSLNDAGIGVFEIDLQTGAVVWSSALVRMFDLDVQSVTPWADAVAKVHDDDLAAVTAAADHAMAQGAGGAYSVDCRLTYPGGELRWLSARGRVESVVVEAVTTGLRITGVVTDRTDLARANDRHADMETRRDRFLALLAHDLRNPLAPLHTAAELLRRAELQPARVIAISEMLTRQVGQMSHLIDDLVDVSRANQGRIQLQCTRVDVRSVVDQSLASMKSFVDRRQQTVDVRIADDGGGGNATSEVYADPQRLEQIVTHLLEHASRSSVEGSALRLEIDRADGMVLISVTDRGAGIDREDLSVVFDLYPPADVKQSRRPNLGTGLALVKALTLLHGGTVEASSEGEGLGATYSVRLPADE